MDSLIALNRASTSVAVLILNRPDRKNALSVALRDEVTEALASLAIDADLKTVVLTGAGSAFCAGFDLGEFQLAAGDPAFETRLWESSDRYHEAFLTFPLPIVAAVNGPAMGGGFDTAVMCDLRTASQAARFGHPEIVFGDVVYSPLHDLVGGAVARDLCLTGRTVSAEEAKSMGLVSTLFDASSLLAETIAIAEVIARAPRAVLQRTKAKFIARAGIEFRTTLQL
jgi:enoyl-CoA hydratase